MKVNRIIRILLNRLRKMDGRRPLLCVVGVLAVLVLTVTVMSRLDGVAGSAFGDRVDGEQETDGLLEGNSEEPVTEALPPETTEPVETEPYRIPVGMLYYVKLTEYGETLPYYDEEGNEIGRLNHREQIEVLPWEGGEAVFYYNEDYDTATISAEYLSEADPGRLVRPFVQPTLSPEDAGKISIVVWKERRELELLSDGEVIATYTVGLGGWPYDHKIAQGDSRTPEGEYYICTRKNSAKFYRSLGISYPNKEDAANAYKFGTISKKQKNAIDAAIDARQQPLWNTAIGGAIMIHGEGEEGWGGEYDWTAGCIAVNNEVIDILWEYCKMGCDVTIYP
ncbi:MAG: L,D-transpeptidase family protein [Lachnospiraceae bacterium]|nr:L,D-transpeptidase family protein [Lachnospiraceae bacterium]